MPLFTKDKDKVSTTITNASAGGDIVAGNKTDIYNDNRTFININQLANKPTEAQNTLSTKEFVSLLKEASKKLYINNNQAEGRLLTYAETKCNIHIPDIKNEITGSSQSLYDSIINNQKNYSLTGCGGSGKTFMIFDCIKQLLDKQDQIIPFYIPLHYFNNSVENTNELLLQYLISQLSLCNDKQLKLWLKEERVNDNPYPLLFLDGFNEITNKDLAGKIVTEVRDFQRVYPQIRFVISSRYDLSSKFTASGSGELCFEQCAVKELDDIYVNQYIKTILSENLKYNNEKINNHLNSIDKRYRKVLSTPMALAMHVKLLLNEKFNLDIPNKNPKTTGELIENFISLLQRSPDTGEFRDSQKNIFHDANLILKYIGYHMNLDGIFDMEKKTINHYLNKVNKEFHISMDLEQFKNIPTVKTVITFPSENDDYGKIEFMHQNFRDYYCAAFLKKVLNDANDSDDTIYSRKNIIRHFRKHLPKEALVLLGEILQEYQYIKKTDDLSLLNKVLISLFSNIRNDENASITISQLIEIAQVARKNNLNNFDFSGLDLSKTQLNNIKLYDYNNANTAMFKNTYLTDYTFRANGHAGAIFTMAFVDDTYLISFSRGSVWCYDIEQRIHYQVSSYSNNAPRASVHISDKKMIITGDDSGCLTVWSYEASNHTFNIKECKKFDEYNAKIQNMVYVKEKNICFFVLQNSDAYFFDTLSMETPKKFYFGNNCMQKMCAITADDYYVYIASGKKIISIKIDDAISNSVYTNVSSSVFCYHLDKPIDYIFDITTRKNKNKSKTILYFSGNSNDYAGSEGFSEIYYTVLKRKGLTENTKFNSVMASKKQWVNGFKGYNNFSLRYGDEQNLYVCVYLDNPAIPNIYEIEIEENIGKVTAVRLVDCSVGTHEMSVECAIPLKLPNQNKGIATAAIDRTIEIIDLKTETIFAKLPGYFDGVHMMDFYDNTLYVATYNGSVSAWEYDDEDEKWYCNHVYPIHTQNEWVWEVKHFIHKGTSYLISCSYDNTFVIFQPDTEEVICRATKEDTNETGNINDGKVFSVIPLSNGDILAACGKVLKWFQIDYENGTNECIDKIKFETEVRFLQKNQDDDTLTAILVSKSIHQVKIDYRSHKLFCPIVKSLENGFVFRTTDSISMQNGSTLTVYGGSSDKDKTAYFEVYLSDMCTDSVLGEETVGCRKTYGICSLSLYRYNDKILLFTASYSGNVSIYEIDDSGKVLFRSCLTHYDQALDVIAYEDNLYCSTLDGKVFCWSLQEILKDTKEKSNCYKAEDYHVEIFQTASGFMMNHVNFSEAECNLSNKYRSLIEQYHAFFE